MTSQQPAHPYVGVLTAPPFFTVPGINPASPISTQAEQLDQMNTLLLQTIDANFARVHQIITTRILPEIKRFAIASEPTRRSAEFWHHFFTSAAAVDRIILPGEESEAEVTMSSAAEPTQYHDHTMGVEGSFMSAFDPPPGPGVSSTPLPNSKASRRNQDPSWDESEIESPFARVDRDLELATSLHEHDAHSDSSKITTPSVVSAYHPPGAQYEYDASTGTVETPDLPQYLAPRLRESAAKGKDKDADKDVHVFAAPPSESTSSDVHASVTAAFEAYAAPRPSIAGRASILGRTYADSDASDSTMSFGRFTATIRDDVEMEPSRASSTTLQRSTASRLLRESTRSAAPSNAGDGEGDNADDVDTGKTPRPTRPRPSTHLIDLTNTPLNIAKFTQNLTSNYNTSRPAPSAASRPTMRNLLEDSEDDMGKFDKLFSPPVTMQFTLPPRASAIYAAAREPPTPKATSGGDEHKTQQVLNDLLADMTASFSPSPVMPAEFRRYSVMPGDIKGAGRRLFADSDSPAGGAGGERRGASGNASGSGSGGASGSVSGGNIFAPRASNSPNVFAPAHAAYDPNSPFNPDTYAYPPGGSRPSRRSMANTSFGSDIQPAPDSPGRELDDDEDDLDDDELDSFDDTIQGQAAADAAVAAAGAGFDFEDDSYMSDGDESYLAARHGAGGGQQFTDTHVVGRGSDNTSEVFGRPSGGRGEFALHQQDEMLTYHGGRLEDARVPNTPLGGGEADISSLGQRR